MSSERPAGHTQDAAAHPEVARLSQDPGVGSEHGRCGSGGHKLHVREVGLSRQGIAEVA